MRARLIKPGFWANEVLAELPFEGRLLFVGLWNLADREGRLEDRPLRIKGEIFRYDPISGADVDRLLDMLAARGFIVRYDVGGHRYIQVCGFTKHQAVHPREPESTIPAPHGHGDGMHGHEAEKFHGQGGMHGGMHGHGDGGETCTGPSEAEAEADTEAEGDVTPPTPPRRPKPRAGLQPASPDGADAPSSPVQSQPIDLLIALCEEIGADVSVLTPAERSKQLAVTKRLVGSGATPEEIRRQTRWLLAQPWVDGVDLFLLEKQRGKWVLAGRPAAPRCRDRPNRPDYRDL